MSEDNGVPASPSGSQASPGAAKASPPSVSIPNAFAGVAGMLPKDLSWQYKSSVHEGRLYHTWALTGDRGGIHVDAWFSESSFRDSPWYGGIECHSPIKQSEYGSDKPDHEHCWLLCGPCWHDGSSFQFSEEIAPMLPRQDGPMGDYEHRAVLSTMLHRYRSWLPEASAIEARRAETGTGSVEDESAVRDSADAQQPLDISGPSQ